jgi:hypothetical protein
MKIHVLNAWTYFLYYLSNLEIIKLASMFTYMNVIINYKDITILYKFI